MSGRISLARVQSAIRAFVAERDWERFHSPKNLAMALAVEAAELMEIFQWMTPEESRRERLPERKRRMARDEVADVLILALNLSGVLGFDPAEAALEKLARAARKYPARRYRGRYEPRRGAARPPRVSSSAARATRAPGPR